MAYTDAQNLTDRNKGIAGVALVHVGIGGLLMIGLATTVITPPEDETIIGIQLDPIEPPPPPDTKTKPKGNSVITVPPNDFTLPADENFVEVIDDVLPLDEGNSRLAGNDEGPPISDPIITPKPTPSFTPIITRPRNNAGGWITSNDYKRVWISREYTGTARFQLDIGSNGRVENCTITRSTGHTALDKATCRLITKRARFHPAQDEMGAAIAGTYSSSIRWELPD